MYNQLKSRMRCICCMVLLLSGHLAWPLAAAPLLPAAVVGRWGPRGLETPAPLRTTHTTSGNGSTVWLAAYVAFCFFVWVLPCVSHHFPLLKHDVTCDMLTCVTSAAIFAIC
jgi:hypothetical protein